MDLIGIGREVADVCGHFTPNATIDMFVGVKGNSFAAARHIKLQLATYAYWKTKNRHLGSQPTS
jgi:hypothetical protein